MKDKKGNAKQMYKYIEWITAMVSIYIIYRNSSTTYSYPQFMIKCHRIRTRLCLIMTYHLGYVSIHINYTYIQFVRYFPFSWCIEAYVRLLARARDRTPPNNGQPNCRPPRARSRFWGERLDSRRRSKVICYL